MADQFLEYKTMYEKVSQERDQLQFKIQQIQSENLNKENSLQRFQVSVLVYENS